MDSINGSTGTSEDWLELNSTPGFEGASPTQLRQSLIDASKLWLAHDGLWFLAIEKMEGMDKAIEADTEAWRVFASLEARRIMERLGIKPGGGVPALAECFRHRLYANICRFNLMARGDRELRLRMVDCRVQDARHRKSLPPFPCKSVGIVEFSTFASTVDPRFETTCVQCPPDETTPGGWCEWVFSIPD